MRLCGQPPCTTGQAAVQRSSPKCHWQCHAEGAERETWEEAEARVDIAAPYAHLDIPMIGQTYIFFRGTLAAPFTFAAGPESSDVQLFAPDAIPYDEIAFSSVSMTLQQWVSDKSAGTYTLRHGVIRKKAGASPYDPAAYTYQGSYDMPSGEAAHV